MLCFNHYAWRYLICSVGDTVGVNENIFGEVRFVVIQSPDRCRAGPKVVE